MRKAIRILLTCFLGLLPFCHSSLATGDDVLSKGDLSEKLEFEHSDGARTYRVYAPNPIPGKPCPAVLLLHGHGGNADQILGLNGRKAPYRAWLRISDRENVILIVPDGTTGADAKQGWNDSRAVSTNPVSDDVAFLRSLIDHAAKSYPVDAARVYATGTSNGGHMSLRLAAEASDVFVAVASVAASNPVGHFDRSPYRPVSVMLINGTKDRILPYRGGDGMPPFSVPSVMKDRVGEQGWGIRSAAGVRP